MIKVTAISKENINQFLDLLKKDFKNLDILKAEKQIANLSEQEELLVCLTDSNQAIGFAKTTTLTKGLVKLDYIYVTPDFRRDKNGSVILVAVYNRAVNRLTAGLIAECSQEKTEGLAFLKARGFIESMVNEGVVYLNKSLIHMYKTAPHDH